MYFTKFTEKPFEIFGLEVIDKENDKYYRLPDDEVTKVSSGVHCRAWTCGGGRIRFRTNSKEIAVRVELYENSVDPLIPLPGSAGVDVIYGSGVKCNYLSCVSPGDYETTKFEERFTYPGDESMNVTIDMPRNSSVKMIEIGVDDGASLLPPIPYSYEGKICYYGSSITEGGCVTHPGNAYTSILSRWLDIDHVNYGFSGSARGELAMADLIGKRDFRVIVIDYDHNAPDTEFLRNTHEPFFKRIREWHPETPIVIMSRPSFDSNIEESVEHREVIRQTYLNAGAAGDKNIYFIDGEMVFGELGRECCRVDEVHPSDVGHFKIAEYLYPFMKRLLDKGIK